MKSLNKKEDKTDAEEMTTWSCPYISVTQYPYSSSILI